MFNALVQINNIKYLETTDASTFLYYYYRSNAVANEIKAMKGSVEEFVYQNMPVNHWFGISSQQAIDFEDILDSIRTEACGYYDLSASLVGNSEYESLVSEYVIILKNLSETDGYEATADYAARVKSVFDKFIALSPSEQYSLLATFNVLYTVGSPELTFDDSEENLKTGSLSQFNIIINSFMRSKLSAENTAIYNNLILAIEIYANRSGYDGWKKDFTDRMNAVKTALDSMTNEDDKNNFNTYLGAAYKKYSDIKANLDTDIELGEWQDEFDMLRDALINVQTGYSIMSRNGTYFLASFERASAIAEKILSGASDKIKEAYYHRALFEAYPADAEKGTEAIFWTYDYAITLYRNVYVDFLLFYSESRINIYDTYVNTNVGKFLDTYYDMIVAFLGGNDGSAPMFNRENTLNVLNEFRLLNSATKSLFGILDNLAIEDGEPVSLYYSALSMFIKEAFTEKAAAVATKLYLLEQYYYSYETSPNSVTLKALVATLDQLKELYKDLSGVDSDSFAPLVESYDYYVEKCEELTK